MRRKELIQDLVEKTNLRPSVAKIAVDCIIESMTDAIAKGEPIFIRSFATLKPFLTQSKVGHNFWNNTQLPIGPRPKVRVVLSRTLKKRMLDNGR